MDYCRKHLEDEIQLFAICLIQKRDQMLSEAGEQKDFS